MTTPANGRPPGHSTPPAGPGGAGPMLPRCEHVWIIQKTLDAGRAPGILLAFRRNRRGRWEGWVIWATPGIPAHGGEPHLQLGWIDAERIEQRVERSP